MDDATLPRASDQRLSVAAFLNRSFLFAGREQGQRLFDSRLHCGFCSAVTQFIALVLLYTLLCRLLVWQGLTPLDSQLLCAPYVGNVAKQWLLPRDSPFDVTRPEAQIYLRNYPRYLPFPAEIVRRFDRFPSIASLGPPTFPCGVPRLRRRISGVTRPAQQPVLVFHDGEK